MYPTSPWRTASPHTPADPIPLKILIAGGFAVGKTTMVKSVSEVRPLSTEALLTMASLGVDDLTGARSKTETTVAFDFGRISFPEENLRLYLWGTPGQERFWFWWDELATGAIGAAVVVDTNRLEDCFPAVDYFLSRQLPFVVARNQFEGTYEYDPAEVRDALELGPDVPVVTFDARIPASVKQVLIAVVAQAQAARAQSAAL
ncbi:ATP/GTP-binding protein [Streptomyces cellulosae]|uniref:ATP/GTP-binding protein n=1 Tax=Streptomyces althioticus TaxID=83380 RepID=A0ABZ1YJF5_9ACTN|nr:ATP/GTP-binding protein [Streptomyces cellulosae]WTB93367.1 ATP/GTP-binding protein [Streptomyces cellulosae]WTC60759.1 ATP/GTP-binding protein [Streptomyces cellulosae]